MFEKMEFSAYPRRGKEVEGEERKREEVEGSADGPSGTHGVKK